MNAEQKAEAIANCTINTAQGSAGMMCSCGHHRRLFGSEAQAAFGELVRAAKLAKKGAA